MHDRRRGRDGFPRPALPRLPSRRRRPIVSIGDGRCRSPLGHRRAASPAPILPVTNPIPARRTRPLVRAAAVLAAAVVAAVVPWTAQAAGRAPSASPAPGVFGIGPAGIEKGTDGRSVTKVDGRPYYYYLAQPGSKLTDLVAVVNVGTTPIRLSVYSTDASNSLDGSFSFPAAADKPRDVGTWVHVTLPHDASTVIKGRSTAFLPVTVTVPANASPGDHAGALVASLQGEVKNSQGQLVHLDQRVATRMFFRISGLTCTRSWPSRT